MTTGSQQQQVLAPQQKAIYQTHFKALPLVAGGKGQHIDVVDPNTGEQRTILDGCSGAAVSSIGHGDEEIRQAMKDAADDVVYNFPILMANKQSEALAQYLIDISPEGAFESALITGSGSESIENTLKIIRKYHLTNGDTKRVKFLSRHQSYHGFTIGAMSIADNARVREFEDILIPREICPKTSACYPYRHQKKGETTEQYKDRLLAELEESFQKEGPETIGAFIAETVTGSTFGCNPPIPGYLDGARDICHKHGALFVLDEVMCGMGRSGTVHAWEQFLEGPGPDIQTIGKTLGAGYVTVAGILISPQVMKLFRDNNAPIAGAQTYHQHSFNSQVALAVQKKVIRDGLIDNIRKTGNYLGAQFAEVLKDNKHVGNVRGVGGFWAIEFVKDKATKEPFPADVKFAPQFAAKLYENGVFALCAGGTVDSKVGDHALFSPAFSLTKEEADEIVAAVKKTCDHLDSIY
ncbi:Glutamate-1-semialdehyde 2,1-aminomutase [Wickerhamomyces ciferrii]|uniref:Glutamate-1-semialdehyde 2,1-aminomutase n=1 Tax=Wickerhamomyces ciferrii (strain ATCC 14091 / BCRC 22168 / CBS 111 / JCM 3599 / NBRC 0793 / NRRL Y-1031 F-60-10) TaxID=1206466 RepID=K0KCL7_WICCF|nr:Glutamate-1-semialdehyde 2,1-aminomutase [Wickerhamomyces ciferrii]CCH40641.1 Glutamate-1-semialdehyde 2,1-aminomutase [Wickerhamomyces ciferrii]